MNDLLDRSTACYLARLLSRHQLSEISSRGKQEETAIFGRFENHKIMGHLLDNFLSRKAGINNVGRKMYSNVSLYLNYQTFILIQTLGGSFVMLYCIYLEFQFGEEPVNPVLKRKKI